MPASNFTPRIVLSKPLTFRDQSAPKRFGVRSLERLVIASGHPSKAALAAARCAVAILSVGAAIVAMPASARGDTLFQTNVSSNTIGEDTTSGATVNASRSRG